MRWRIGVIVTAAAALMLVVGRSDLDRSSPLGPGPGSSMPAPTAEEESGEVHRAPLTISGPPAGPQMQPPNPSARRRRERASGAAPAPEPRPEATARSAAPASEPSATASQESPGFFPPGGGPSPAGDRVEDGGQEPGPVPPAPPPETGSAPAGVRAPVLSPPVLLGGAVDYPGDAHVLAVDRSLVTPELRLLLPEGRVVLRVLVLADGTVDRVEVAESSGHPALDRAAVEAARSWQFRPAMRDGEPIAAWAVIPVRFMLR